MRIFATARRIAALGAAIAFPFALSAQEDLPEDMPRFDLEAGAGVALPAADLVAFTDPGLHVGVGAGWWLDEHWAIRADGDLANLRGEERGTATPDLRLFHYGLGVEVDVLGRDATSPWTVEANAGAGGMTLDTDAFGGTVPVREDVTETYPNVNAGLELGRRFAEGVSLSVAAQGFYSFLSEDDLARLSSLRAGEELEDGLAVPLTLSVRWDIPTSPGYYASERR